MEVRKFCKKFIKKEQNIAIYNKPKDLLTVEARSKLIEKDSYYSDFNVLEVKIYKIEDISIFHFPDEIMLLLVVAWGDEFKEK